MFLVQLEAFKKEIAEFPVETREDIFSLIYRFLNGEQTLAQGNTLVLLYAFHKKSQELREKEKDTIRSRIRRIEL
jgi:phage-related protein